MWASGRELTEFAHRRSPHVEAIRRTAEERWYSEELFARLAVVGGSGSFCGTTATALAEPA